MEPSPFSNLVQRPDKNDKPENGYFEMIPLEGGTPEDIAKHYETVVNNAIRNNYVNSYVGKTINRRYWYIFRTCALKEIMGKYFAEIEWHDVIRIPDGKQRTHYDDLMDDNNS